MGSARAQFLLGRMLAFGRGTAADPAAAAASYRRAAEQGHVGAQLALAACYSEGFGVDMSVRDAYVWSRLAAMQGDAKASADADALGRRLGFMARFEAGREVSRLAKSMGLSGR